MKYLVVLMCSVMMTGCFYQSVNISDLKKAISYCKGAENVMHINAWSVGSEIVYCTDGTSRNTNKIKL